MSLRFLPNWRQWQQIPFNERHIEDILKAGRNNMPGALWHAIAADNREVLVVSGVHKGGAPGCVRSDPQPHVTLFYDHRAYHVRLDRWGHVLEVTS